MPSLGSKDSVSCTDIVVRVCGGGGGSGGGDVRYDGGTEDEDELDGEGDRDDVSE